MNRRPGAWALLVAAALAGCEAADITDPTGPLDGPLTPAGAQFGYYGLGHINGAVPNPCPAPAHRQFDFWVGGWDVYNPAGAHVATSVITSELGGCVVMEDYISGGGYRGQSLNMYDAGTGTWSQYFMDNIITNYRLEGGIEGGEMVMTGVQPAFRFTPNGIFTGVRDDSIVWKENPDGSVQQTFHTAWDGGARTVGFDGRYVRSDDLDRAPPGTFSYCSIIDDFRAADFWLGSWSVEAAPGPSVGTADVTSHLNACLIIEDFDNGRGYRSRSYLFLDYITGTWHRALADTRGRYVELSGGVDAAGRLVLTGADENPSGETILVRNTLEPTAGGVLQRWETSRDGGESWQPELTVAYGGP